MQRGSQGRGATYDKPEHEAERHGELQFVPTPPGPIHALLDVVTFSGVLCDPCCGDGAMLRVFRERGYQAFGYDIRGDSSPDTVPLDFLKDRWPTDWPADLVTNPPFGPQGRLAELFIGRALQITRAYGGRVAMLLASDFDSAKGRSLLFRDHKAFAGRVILLDRIVWYDRPVKCRECDGTGEIIKKAGFGEFVAAYGTTCPACKGAGERKVSPAENHAWFWWDWAKPAGIEPVVRYSGWT